MEIHRTSLLVRNICMPWEMCLHADIHAVWATFSCNTSYAQHTFTRITRLTLNTLSQGSHVLRSTHFHEDHMSYAQHTFTRITRLMLNTLSTRITRLTLNTLSRGSHVLRSTHFHEDHPSYAQHTFNRITRLTLNTLSQG